MLRVKLSYFFLSMFPLLPPPKKDNVLSATKLKITFAIQFLVIYLKKSEGEVSVVNNY
jgi:hypothetical protein